MGDVEPREAEGGGADRRASGVREDVGAPISSSPMSFAAVFEAQFDTIFRYFARRVPRAEAPDMTAETFRLAHGAWDRFDQGRGSPRPWLYGFAGNVLRHHLRGHVREARAIERAGLRDDGPREDAGYDARLDALDAAASWPVVDAALDALAPVDREALLLLAWEELSYAEIAEATGVPVGTVRSRLNRARRQVRERLELVGQQGHDDRDRGRDTGRDTDRGTKEAFRHG